MTDCNPCLLDGGDTCLDCDTVYEHSLPDTCPECGSDVSVSYRNGCAAAGCSDDDGTGCEWDEEDGHAAVRE